MKDITREMEIRQGMEKLWNETFGDLDAYIKLVFDNYFDEDLTATFVHEGEVKSALMGVPYLFKGGGSGATLKGLYLCGLATRQDMRGKGIMTSLLEEINEKALEKGFDFTFLVPASESLSQYYSDRHYHNAFYKIREHFVVDHDFKVHDMDKTVLKTFSGPSDSELLQFLMKNEQRGVNAAEGSENSPVRYDLVHSDKDWRAVLEEALISDQPVKVLYSSEGEIRGVAFIEIKGTEVIVKRIILSDEKYRDIILHNLLKMPETERLTLIYNVGDTKDLTRIWQPFYMQNNAESAEYEDVAVVQAPFVSSGLAQPFGMCRILDVRALLNKMEGVDGKKYDDFSDDELTALLLRKPMSDASDPIGELLGYIELDLNASLLLE